MTSSERIRLELEDPSGDALYVSPSPPRSDDDFYDPWRQDHSSRLMAGAWARDFDVQNESARTVRALFLNEPESTQIWLGSAIVNCINERNSEVVGALVVDLGLANALWSISDPQQIGLLASGLADALMHRPRTPTTDELSRIVQWAEHALRTVQDEADPDSSSMEDAPPPGRLQRRNAGRLLQVSRDTQRFRQRQEILRGENPIVDRDRRELLDRLSGLQVSVSVRDLLHAADSDADGGDYKGAMEKLRTFLERTCEGCCRSASKVSAGLVLPENNAGGSIAAWKEYAVKAQLLSKREGEVVQAVSSFLAMEGSHAVASTPEQFSVARTTVIEWCLLLAGRCGHQAERMSSGN